MSGRQRRGTNLGLVLLGSQLLNVGVTKVPPVTLALIAGQVAIFMDMIPQYFPSANAVCMSSYIVWYHKKWERLILSALFHADDMHLYFNMSSLIWKGMFLEKKFRSVYFAYLVSVFTCLTSLVYIGLNMLLEEGLSDHSYGMQCAVGFSGVLFALKVLVTHYTPPGRHLALGFIPVPSRMIYWVELILIQLITPNASFTGHLAGILVGLLYVKGPLKLLMDSVISPDQGTNHRAHGSGYRSGYSSGYSSQGNSQSGSYGNSQPSGSYDNSQSGSYGNSQTGSYGNSQGNYDRPSAPPPPYGFRDDTNNAGPGESSSNSNTQRLYPDLDELRQQRMRHYQ